MTDFHGRVEELEILGGELDRVARSGRARLVVVQGRRQVGKSTLVERFAERSRVPYASMTGMKGTPEGIQVRRALEAVQSAKLPLPDRSVFEATRPASAWTSVLGLLAYSVGASPAVVVLDEFPWMVETSPGLDGLLKALLDAELGRRAVLVVLVGSDEAMMERLFEHERPLFAKANRRLVVDPFDPSETRQALGGERAAMEVFDAQLVTGGFPGLVDEARRYRSAAQFVRAALADRHSPLVDTAEIRLAGELADSANAERVLRAIGADVIGEVKFSRIAETLGGGPAAQTAVTRSVDVLVRTKRMVAVDLPAGERRRRLTQYRIADPYLRFWFRFVEPHLRNIEVGRSDIPVADFERSWETWRGGAVEPVVRQAFGRLCPRLGEPYQSVVAVGGWWDRVGQHELDLVGTGAANEAIVIGSIKWRAREKFTAGELAALASGRGTVPGAAAARLAVVCPAGVRNGVEPDLVLGPEQLLEAWA